MLMVFYRIYSVYVHLYITSQTYGFSSHNIPLDLNSHTYIPAKNYNLAKKSHKICILITYFAL